MKRVLPLVLPLCLFFMMANALPGQTFKAYMKAGNKAMKQKNYGAALQYYQEAMTFKATDPNVWFRYAESARQYQAYEEAAAYYQKIMNSKLENRFPMTAFRLGEVQRSLGNYGNAKSLFQQYISQEGASAKFATEAKQQMADCDFALATMDKADDLTIHQLNKRVNTGYSEFGPLLSGDTLYYSSFRFKNTKDDHEPPRKISRILTSVKGGRGRPLPRKFNEAELHTAHTTFSTDQKRIYFTICKYFNSTEISCELYFREKDKRKRWQKKPVKLPESINMPTTTTTQPNIGRDAAGKEWLYFVSNRPGGKGGLDIWAAEVKGKSFGNPINLTSLNTEGDDITPFWHRPSNTLYFSSNRRQGMGGHDIYKAQRTGTDNWSEVAHTGYPLNSSYNDLYFTLNADSTLAYFASNRLGSFYLEKTNKACCNDIYQVRFPQDSTERQPPPPDSLTIVLTEPEPDPPGPPPVKEKIPTTLEEFLPLALYFHNDEPDRRTRRTYTKKSYEETYHPYYALKWEYQREYAKPMPSELRYQGEEEITYFFEKKVRKGYEHLNLFSEILLTRLREGERVEIFVKGFTSPRAKSDYNISLGKRRISSVKNHFKTWRGSILKPYIDSGQLILSEKSFGETTAASSISDDLYDLRNSIYHPAAAEERRVEIVEIKRN